jgi:hypothetical protein
MRLALTEHRGWWSRDRALYVLGMLKGPEEARKVQKFMEYDPAPPYAEVTA